jgi:hypothetical protein
VVLAGNSLPWAVRLAIGLILVAANIPAIRVAVLLRGARGVRIVEWDEEGRIRLRLGAGLDLRPATLQVASFRLGIVFLVLWFATPAGARMVVIDGGRQDPVAFRRLCRHLARGMLIPSRPKV